MCRRISPSFFGRHEARRSPKFLIRAVVILAVLALSAVAPARAQSQKMKLLTPTTGWVSSYGHLYWTTDSGSHWIDITPVPPGARRAGVGLVSVFFLNTHEGWAVIYLPGKPVSLAPQPHRPQNTLYDIAHTVDGGMTWSFTPFTYPSLTFVEEDTLAGLGGPFFIDSLHGWMNVGFAGNSQPGTLVATIDGGRTWTRINSPGLAGIVRFTSLRAGWFFGGPYNQLFVTHDGCKSWQEVRLTPPPEVGAATDATFQGPPAFSNREDGFVVVHYSGRGSTPSKLVIYTTHDAGRTWEPVKVLPERRVFWQGVRFPFAITDSILVVATGSKKIDIGRIYLSGDLPSPVVVSAKGVYGLTFADATHGMVLTGSGVLYTSDGGRTWKNVTPWPVFMPTPSHAAPHFTHPKLQIEVAHPAPHSR